MVAVVRGGGFLHIWPGRCRTLCATLDIELQALDSPACFDLYFGTPLRGGLVVVVVEALGFTGLGPVPWAISQSQLWPSLGNDASI